VAVQVAMSLLRFVSLGLLLFGTLFSLSTDNVNNINSSRSSNSSRTLFNIDGFGLVFTTSVFSQLFQHSVPGLIRPLSYHHRPEIPRIFGAALLTTACLYICTASAAVLYFGDKTHESINLNFVGYAFDMPQESPFRPLAEIASTIIVLFPALDTLSVYPLIANTLGNNLHASFTTTLDPLAEFFDSLGRQRGPDTQIQSRLQTQEALQQQQQKQQQQEQLLRRQKIAVSIFRLIASLPPIIGSLFVHDLTISLQLAGFAGIVVALVTPSILKIKSMSHAAESFTGVHAMINPYRVTGVTDLPEMPYFVLALSALAFIVCFVQFYNSSS
jgi:amino acid permease